MRFSFLLLTALTVVIVWAPNLASARLRPSVYGVGGYSMLQGTDLTDPTFKMGKLGFGGGVGLEVPLSRLLGLELGGYYMSRQLTQVFSVAGTVSADTHFLLIPLLLRAHFGKYLFLTGGLYGGYGFGSVTLTDTNGGVTQGGFNDAQIANIDVGFLGGLGVEIPIKSFCLFVEGRYMHGLVNVGTAIPLTATINFTDYCLLQTLARSLVPMARTLLM